MREWSTPLRVSSTGGNALPPVPNELHLEIFEYVTHSPNFTQKERVKALKNLALVCRLFHSIAVPRIFRRLHIRNTNFAEVITAGATVFCASVLSGLEPPLSLACHVEECVLQSQNKFSELQRFDHEGYNEMYGRAIGQFSNLQSLTFRSVALDIGLLYAISKLKSLKYLLLDNISLQMKPIDYMHLTRISPVTLKEFSILDDDDRLNKEYMLDALSRVVDLAQLESLTIHGHDTVHEILAKINTNVLSKLVLHKVGVKFLPSLWNNLAKLSLLETLEIEMVSQRLGDLSISTPPAQLTSALPNLKRLACPPSMLFLVPGRAISSITISPNYRVSDPTAQIIALAVIPFLKQSSATLIDVSIPRSFYSCTPFLETLSSMRKLQLDIGTRSFLSIPPLQIVQEIVSVEHLPGLLSTLRVKGRLVQMNTEEFLKSQPGLFSRLTQAFPNLLEVQLVEDEHWCRDTVKDSWRRRYFDILE